MLNSIYGVIRCQVSNFIKDQIQHDTIGSHAVQAAEADFSCVYLHKIEGALSGVYIISQSPGGFKSNDFS
jgi:hypothetical protein